MKPVFDPKERFGEAFGRALAALPPNEERPAERGALFLGDREIGSIARDALECLTAFGEARAKAASRGLVLEDPGTPEARGDRFALIAKRFLETGILEARLWRGELLDLWRLDAAEAPLAHVERSLFRTLGMKTRSVHLVAREAGTLRYPLSLRSRRKAIGAGLWDVLAAGMISAGETPQNALLREANEEAGLILSEEPELFAQRTTARLVESGLLLEESFFFDVELSPGTAFRSLDGETEAFRTFEVPQILALIPRHGLMWEAAEGILLSLAR